MDNSLAVAAASAVVATGVTLVVSQLRKVSDEKAHRAEIAQAELNAHQRGWFEGRESILQQFQPRTPQDFAPTT